MYPDQQERGSVIKYHRGRDLLRQWFATYLPTDVCNGEIPWR